MTLCVKETLYVIIVITFLTIFSLITMKACKFKFPKPFLQITLFSRCIFLSVISCYVMPTVPGTWWPLRFLRTGLARRTRKRRTAAASTRRTSRTGHQSLGGTKRRSPRQDIQSSACSFVLCVCLRLRCGYSYRLEIQLSILLLANPVCTANQSCG